MPASPQPTISRIGTAFCTIRKNKTLSGKTGHLVAGGT
jgi:hypothetical protein